MHKIKYFLRRSVLPTTVLVLLLAMALLVVGCGGGNDSNSADNNKPVLVFADVSWDSIKVHNRIAGFIIEHGYGYPAPEYRFGDSVPTLQGLSQGSIDIYMEVWADNYKDIWEKMINDGSVKKLGSNYPDAPQGWYIPTYVIKGDADRGIEAMAPDLKSVSDLPEYWELFKDSEVPNKGRFHNSPPGWVVTDMNEGKIKAYELDSTFNVFSTGSDTALATSMVSAYEKGEAWLGYYWEPTWIMGKLDMTKLEEPSFDKEVFEKNYGCEYAPAKVYIAVNSELEKTAPEIVEFLSKYSTTLEQNNEFLAYMQDNNSESEDAAIYFLKNYPDVWKSWLPEDVANAVEETLKEVK